MKIKPNQPELFDKSYPAPSLPVDYEPVRPDYFKVSQIFLTSGSFSTPERKLFVERICALYPEAKVTECLDTPHNRINLSEIDALTLLRTGKQTLVFGELKSAVRFSEEEGNTCHNYCHFSPYGFLSLWLQILLPCGDTRSEILSGC